MNEEEKMIDLLGLALVYVELVDAALDNLRPARSTLQICTGL